MAARLSPHHRDAFHYVRQQQRQHDAKSGLAAKASKAKSASEGTSIQAPVRDLSGDHPSASPDGRLVITGTIMTSFGGELNEWGAVLTDVKGTGQMLLHRFDNSHGAKSWRVSHPHPVFSADGKRIYFNVSEGEFTRLFVAELKYTQAPFLHARRNR